MSTQTHILLGMSIGLSFYFLLSRLPGEPEQFFPPLIYVLFLISFYRDKKRESR